MYLVSSFSRRLRGDSVRSRRESTPPLAVVTRVGLRHILVSVASVHSDYRRGTVSETGKRVHFKDSNGCSFRFKIPHRKLPLTLILIWVRKNLYWIKNETKTKNKQTKSTGKFGPELPT